MQWEQGGNVGTHEPCARPSELQAYSTWLLGRTHELYIPTTAGIINLSTRLCVNGQLICMPILLTLSANLGSPLL